MIAAVSNNSTIYNQYGYSNMQKKEKQFKLPTIPTRTKDASRVLSNTMPENITKLRPASLNKVEDLEKKLFNKLDAYESTSRKAIGKRMSKTRKVGEGENVKGEGFEGDSYEKMQKMMPELYNKLVEAKKGTLSDLPPPPPSDSGPRSQKRIARPILSAELKKRESGHAKSVEKKEPTKILEPETILSGSIEASPNIIESAGEGRMMAEEELERYYAEYLEKEQLPSQTPRGDLEAMNQSILVCEKQIQHLTRSMEGLIREIGLECIRGAEQELE